MSFIEVEIHRCAIFQYQRKIGHLFGNLRMHGLDTFPPILSLLQQPHKLESHGTLIGKLLLNGSPRTRCASLQTRF
jgi:hypothetical protein